MAPPSGCSSSSDPHEAGVDPPNGRRPGDYAPPFVKFWQSVHGVESDQVVEVAKLADDLGYYGITFGDHIVKPVEYDLTYLYSDTGRPPWDPEALGPAWTPPYPDPWILSSVLAQHTERLRFMPYVYVLPLRDPVLVAKQLATAAFFSGGRVVFGIGTGWLQEEFTLVHQEWKARGARTDEMLEVIAALVTGRDTEFHGRFYDVPPVRMAPVPPEPVPVMVGGHSDAALRRAAAADGWLGVDYELDDLPPLIAKLNGYRRELGTEDTPFEIMAVVKSALTSGLDDRSLDRLEEMGVTMTQDYAWLYKGEPRSPFERKRETMERFAERWIR
jgi:probable F420-dependent oxidoreductase